MPFDQKNPDPPRGGYQGLDGCCQTQDDFPPIAIQAALEVIRERERERGTPDNQHPLFIAAAGNYANTRPSWPAALPGVVSQASGVHPRAALAAFLATGQPVPGFGQAVRILPGV